MDYVLKNGTALIDGKLIKTDLAIINGAISLSLPTDNSSFKEIDCLNKFIFPGLVDVHVHFREPGFSYKETIKSGTDAAASSGYSAVMTMPNLKPVPDSVQNLAVQMDAIERDALIRVYPFASITKGEKGEELSDMDDMAKFVLGFSDDGVGVQSELMMERAMEKAKLYDKVISAHCEDNALLNGGYIHDGEYARAHGHRGIPSESEYRPIERDIKLVEKTGVKYHVCHVSAKESVEVIRRAKKKGLSVTAETAPHYLVFCDDDLKEDGAYKMNPPIRSKADMNALIEGIKDGTIDMIATDHAPHSKEEKGKGLKSLNGIVGIEVAFPIIYTKLVKTGVISMEKAIELMSINPAKRFGIDVEIKDGARANVAVFDLNTEYQIDSNNFKSMGKCTPFDKQKVFGKCTANFCDGRLVFENDTILR